MYTDQGNIGIYIPAGSYTITLHNGSILAGEIHRQLHSPLNNLKDALEAARLAAPTTTQRQSQ